MMEQVNVKQTLYVCDDAVFYLHSQTFQHCLPLAEERKELAVSILSLRTSVVQ